MAEQYLCEGSGTPLVGTARWHDVWTMRPTHDSMLAAFPSD